VFVKAGSGAVGDIAAAHKALFVGSGSYTKAKAVIVLPMTSRLGTVISAADAGTMSLKIGKKVTKITTTGASVNTTATGKLADVAKGSKVLIAAVRTKAGVTIATEIIILPGDSPFV
jgi:hypothetical protein